MLEISRIRRDCPGEKVVVVSQFSSFLSVLQPLVRKAGIPLTRLDGAMSHQVVSCNRANWRLMSLVLQARAESVRSFQCRRPGSPALLLLSLKAGGVGLNLTAANHLLLLDPAWNPATEWQVSHFRLIEICCNSI